jgi:hypothetical protein
MLRRSLWLASLALVLALTASACGSGGEQPGEASGPAAGETPVGGTLRLALLSDVQEAFDPQKEYYSITWEIYRCCLLRTLLS